MRHGERPLRAYLAPIQAHLNDPETTEIVVNRPGEVGVEQRGRWSWHSVPEFTADRLDQIGILAGYMTGRDFDKAHPLVGATLPDGHRIQLCREPATLPGTIALAIRKPSEVERTLDDDDISDLLSEVNEPVARSSQVDDDLRSLFRQKDFPGFFRYARKAKKTIDVVGVTGSGKTDFMKRLMRETHSDARVITVESDQELKHVGPYNTANLFYNEQHPKLQPTSVLSAVLRMRPDEVFFQETREAEAFAMMRVRAAGHGGGGTTWHAEEGRELDALALMVKQHPAMQHLQLDEVREIALRFIDIIVYCTRDLNKFRITKVWMKSGRELIAA